MGLDPGALAAGFRAWAAAPEPQPALRPALELRVRSRDLLGALTDTLVQPVGTELASRDRYLVMSTPERDDYNDGNILILDRAPEPAEVEDRMADCRREFGARPVLYLSLCWEEEGDIRWEAAPPVAGATGDDLQRLTVLSSAEAPEEQPAPEGIALRPLRTETEWPDLAALAIATHAPGDPGAFAVFARWRYREYHRAFAGPDPGRPDERGRFWGAFRGDRLVGSLGLFESPTLLRFQEVMTHPGERGRGIATALTARALRAGLARRPGAIAVVVAEPGEQAERIYRRLGFGTASTQVWLRRKAL
jgi:ribosomal protein S18 acetylase RimI-like enzyme